MLLGACPATQTFNVIFLETRVNESRWKAPFFVTEVGLIKSTQAQAAGQALFSHLLFLLPPLCWHWCVDGHLETWFKELIHLQTNHHWSQLLVPTPE